MIFVATKKVRQLIFPPSLLLLLLDHGTEIRDGFIYYLFIYSKPASNETWQMDFYPEFHLRCPVQQVTLDTSGPVSN